MRRPIRQPRRTPRTRPARGSPTAASVPRVPGPLVLLQHFRGNLDSWDPALSTRSREARGHPGRLPRASAPRPASLPISPTARQMIAFVDALGLAESTCSGSRSAGSSLRRSRSCGRRSSDASSWRQPARRARRGCTAGATTSPPPRVARATRRTSSTSCSRHTEASQAKGMEFLGRFLERQEGRDAPTIDAARDAQYDAIVEWGSRITPRCSG